MAELMIDHSQELKRLAKNGYEIEHGPILDISVENWCFDSNHKE